jgi:diaminopimelate decarboxylase
MDDFVYRAGRLYCEGVAASGLAERFGTPSYVYSRATLEAHYGRIAGAFRELDPLICYSIKSCGNIGVCRVLAAQGSGMDVVSGGELERAFLAGVPMSKVVYAGVGKTDAEIRAALDGRFSLLRGVRGGAPDPAGRGPIGYFNIESEPEFENIALIARELGVRTRAALRVNPDVDPKTHAYTSTGKKDSKFGVGIERAMAFFDRYGRDDFLKLDAIHLHIGSPVYSTEPYIAAITKALGLIDALAAKGFKVATLDIGGGFGADYETARSPAAADYAAVIVPLLRDRVRAGLRIIIEPGRAISANAGLLLTRVLYVKEGAGKQFVICDAGMNTLIRPSLYSAFHFAWPAEPGPEFEPPRRAEGLDLPGLVNCDIVGPICESGDFLAKDRKLPPVKRGDLIAVFAAGAYGMTMASNYNTQPLPAEVLVEGDSARLVRARQGTADVLAQELALEE